MFADSIKEAVYHNDTDALWALHISTAQFWTWKHWLEDALGYKRNVHGKWLTVWSEWPPTTSAHASSIAQRISDMRDELRILRPVPRRPTPWDGIKSCVPEEYWNTVP